MEMIDTSSLRDLILACRRRYSIFSFDLSIEVFDDEDPVLTAKIQDSLYTDRDIQSCITESFRIFTNDVELAAESKPDVAVA